MFSNAIYDTCISDNSYLIFKMSILYKEFLIILIFMPKYNSIITKNCNFLTVFVEIT